MAEQARKLMTVDEFLRWEDGTDTRYELADGVVRAMAPPSGPHRRIASNANALIHDALRDRRPCRPEIGAGIRIGERTWWRSDIAVTCQPPAPEIIDPLLVVEVLSVGTRIHVRNRKFDDYKTVASVQEIWLIDSEHRWAEIWQRGTQWTVQGFGGSAVCRSEMLQALVPFDELFANSGL